MSRASAFVDEHVGASDTGADFPAIDEGHFVFEDKNLIYSESDQMQHDFEAQVGEESPSDYGATVLWKHVVKGKKCGNAHGGSHVFKCKYCEKIYHGTYTRVYAHLMGHKKGESKGIGYCAVVKGDKNLQMLLQREVEQAESSPSSAPLKKSKLTASFGMTSNGPSLALSYVGPSEKDYQMHDGNDVDSKVMRCLCANGIPFSVLRSPYWDEMITAINRTPGYKSPSCERAQTVLLENERHRVEREFDDFKQKWTQYGISIILSARADVENQSLINILASNQFGSLFLHAFEFMALDKSPRSISDYMLKVLEMVGPHNVVQLITENTANFRAVSDEVMKTYPHIFWTPCMVNILHLILKDLIHSSDNQSLSWLERTCSTAKGLVKYIVDHPQAAEIFQTYPKLELLKVATTRWAHYITLRLLLDVKDAIRAAVLSDQWIVWTSASPLDAKQKLTDQTVKAAIMSDSFWQALQLALCIIKPVYKMVKFTDQDGPLIGEVCERMDNMLGEIKDSLQGQEEVFMAVNAVVIAKWDKMNMPLQCLAHALNPKYYGEEYLQLPGPGGTERRKPDLDDVIFDQAQLAIQKMHPNPDIQDTVRVQFMSFMEKKGRFSSPTAKRDAKNPKINVLQWWKFHGGDTKELRDLAFRVLAQPISSCSVERPWTNYNFICNAKQNGLNANHADDLAYVHSNLRLLSRYNSDYKYGPHRRWDVNAELPVLEESPLKLEDICFIGIDDESSTSKEAFLSLNPIQELLRIIEDVPPVSNQPVEHSHAAGAMHSRGRGRGRGRGGGGPSSNRTTDQKGKTKKFL
ncbi:Ribonuclease H-like protein [Dioscorea alata]|nr:Ribonuclease H-like protein [Dioscorea alata]KAH7655092.1 Ribonuclease H-like protein [Dioscorea alata]